MKVGTEGYKKQFKNLLKGEDILKDPAEAFARNEYEIVRNVLIKIKNLIAKGNYIFLGNRKKNFETLLELGLKYSHVKQDILGLTPKEYSEGPLLDKDQINYKDEFFGYLEKIYKTN